MGPREPDAVQVYAAADLWVDRRLWRDDSLFTPAREIWSARWLKRAEGALSGPAGREPRAGLS